MSLAAVTEPPSLLPSLNQGLFLLLILLCFCHWLFSQSFHKSMTVSFVILIIRFEVLTVVIVFDQCSEFFFFFLNFDFIALNFVFFVFCSVPFPESHVFKEHENFVPSYRRYFHVLVFLIVSNMESLCCKVLII